MRRPNTDSTPNNPVTLPRNQLSIRYVVTSPVHTVTVRGKVRGNDTSVYLPLNFMKIVQCEPSRSMRTERQTEMTKLIVATRNYAKARRSGSDFHASRKIRDSSRSLCAVQGLAVSPEAARILPLV
jgi:hypothetical protein